ncbi:MAG TPA: LLM class flavin-dependent oxidoreductase [Micromonosporaceae bacterium]|jgi:alkanesulfonate monooxygenase SsuD/methylene tetrahydromethanopterin reductase-like flavin-dependent oxidoreductase (luciferase family)
MEIGFGLPNPVPGAPGRTIVDIARRAEERGFAGLATIDRIAYPSHDSLATHAAAAGATTRVRLMTNILVAPAYPPVLLAKTAASIDQLSGGRFTLGVAVGGRADDFAVAGRDFHARGRDLDSALDLMHRLWRGEPAEPGGPSVCPTPVRDGRVPVLIGGTADRALQRVITWGAGWTAGGAPAQQIAPFYDRVRRAWADAGRDGEPRLAALAYFSLGDDVAADSHTYLREYYAFTGPYADRIAEGALRTPAAIRAAVDAFRDAGCTELYFDATAAHPDQVDRLADVVL